MVRHIVTAAIALARQDDGAGPVASRFVVPGIKCANCIGKIERGLNALPGVDSARVNFSTKQLAITHAADLDQMGLVAAISDLGFEAQPLQAAADADADGEWPQLTRALGIAAFGAMNIMLLSVAIWSGAQGVTRDLFHWLSALIALPTVFFAGRPFFSSAYQALRRKRTNMDVPISIGVILATSMSLYETVTGGPHAYFDGAVMLIFFLLCGRVLDAMMRERARAGIASLLRRQAQGALVLRDDGKTGWVAARDLLPGDVMLVAAGEGLAADGTIAKGATQCDLSLINGESKPQAMGVGDFVPAGAINLGTAVHVKVKAVGDDTIIAEIARLMDEAGQSRSRYVRIADRASRLYAPAVHSLALAAFAGWMLAGAGWHESLLIAIAVLIITCPCALGLAVPVAQVVAAGALMKRGILVKDGTALERLAQVDRALFDKTGTLTLGHLLPRNIDCLDVDQQAVALALAQTSRHPVSRSLYDALSAAGVKPAELTDVVETPGEGIDARWNGTPVSLKRPQSAEVSSVELRIGTTGRLVEFSDRLRPHARSAIDAMRNMGIACSIVSGDQPDAVADIARMLNMKAQVRALPADKIAAVDRLTAAGKTVLMVGDGLNDGPALAAAHASLAPGTASDVGQQMADAVFTGEALDAVPVTVRCARRTMSVVRQNFALAIGYNALAVPAAIAGFVTPLVAAVAMSLSSIIVVGNSLRLMRSAR